MPWFFVVVVDCRFPPSAFVSLFENIGNIMHHAFVQN